MWGRPNEAERPFFKELRKRQKLCFSWLSLRHIYIFISLNCTTALQGSRQALSVLTDKKTKLKEFESLFKTAQGYTSGKKQSGI